MQRLILAAGLIVTMAVPGLLAQSTAWKATIPFDFRVGGAPLPAGTYVIHESGAMLTVKDETGRQGAAAIALTNAAIRRVRQSRPELEFHRYGDTYFLASVWAADSPDGRSLLQTRREKELAARKDGGIQTAVIALHQ
jgi:hypothetical protein